MRGGGEGGWQRRVRTCPVVGGAPPRFSRPPSRRPRRLALARVGAASLARHAVARSRGAERFRSLEPFPCESCVAPRRAVRSSAVSPPSRASRRERPPAAKMADSTFVLPDKWSEDLVDEKGEKISKRCEPQRKSEG